MNDNPSHTPTSKPSKPLPRPTAVALGYDPDRDIAPRILAKGGGWLSEKIIELARANNIPIRKDPLLVGALAKLEVDETIPVELYQVVAEVLAYVYRIRGKYFEKKASRSG